jgi:hypothetical protein
MKYGTDVKVIPVVDSDEEIIGETKITYAYNKVNMCIDQRNEGYLPLDHPGGEAQVDFGQAEFYEKGKLIKGHYLNMSFPYSNAGYTQIFRGRKPRMFFRRHEKDI